MKIIDVETYVLVADNYDPSLTSSAQDTCLVIIKTDEGIEGYGECDTSPWVAKAFIESPGTHTMDQCVKEILIGSNPLNINKLCSSIYIGTAMTGRRGAGVNALSAIDMALWDIYGKQTNKPIYELLGGSLRDEVNYFYYLTWTDIKNLIDRDDNNKREETNQNIEKESFPAGKNQE